MREGVCGHRWMAFFLLGRGQLVFSLWSYYCPDGTLDSSYRGSDKSCYSCPFVNTALVSETQIAVCAALSTPPPRFVCHVRGYAGGGGDPGSIKSTYIQQTASEADCAKDCSVTQGCTAFIYISGSDRCDLLAKSPVVMAW